MTEPKNPRTGADVVAMSKRKPRAARAEARRPAEPISPSGPTGDEGAEVRAPVAAIATTTKVSTRAADTTNGGTAPVTPAPAILPDWQAFTAAACGVATAWFDAQLAMIESGRTLLERRAALAESEWVQVQASLAAFVHEDDPAGWARLQLDLAQKMVDGAVARGEAWFDFLAQIAAFTPTAPPAEEASSFARWAVMPTISAFKH